MKKQWISVKCGLSRDPKHRRQMGKAVWTFLHMLDLADWDTGIVYDWKDENAAEDMGIDIRVLREDRRKLEAEDYISCRQKQYSQDITILNWTNPREYSGEIRNKKQGDKKNPPSKNAQGDAQGDAQGSVKDVTPTLDSKNQISQRESKSDVFGFMEMSDKLSKDQQADKVEELIAKLERGLRVNITRTTSNQQAAKRIIKDGRSVDQWLSWVQAEEWRADHLYLYADIEKVWRDFPQAFDNKDTYNPQGLEVGL